MIVDALFCADSCKWPHGGAAAGYWAFHRLHHAPTESRPADEGLRRTRHSPIPGVSAISLGPD